MTATTFGIDVEGVEQAIAAMTVLQSPIDFRQVATDVAIFTQADVDERFDSAPQARSGGVVYGGEFWPALTEPYLAANPRREGGQILRDTGELLQSFQVGGSGNVFEASHDEIAFGSALPKARGLQNKRPMLFVHDELADGIVQVIAENIVRQAI